MSVLSPADGLASAFHGTGFRHLHGDGDGGLSTNERGFTGSDQTVRRPANLEPDDKAQLDAISQRSPAIRALTGHIRGFAIMMRKLTRTRDLPQWIKRVQASDLAAVTAGISLPY